MLLESDGEVKSVSALLVGEPIRGSWWSHSEGKRIFNTCEALADHADILRTKFLLGKVTYVHRRLWRALYVVAAGRAPWQMNGLSVSAKRLLAEIDAQGSLVVPKATKDSRALEARLLALGSSLHTSTGAHAKGLESWEHWRLRTDVVAESLPIDEAIGTLEAAAESIGLSRAKLPWRQN